MNGSYPSSLQGRLEATQAVQELVMADRSQDRDDSFGMMPRSSDEEVEKGEEEDGGKSEDASGSSRTTSEGSSGGNAQEVLLAISKAYTSGRLGTAPPASHSEQSGAAPVHVSSAPLQAIQGSSAEESGGSGPSAATGPSPASKEELSPLVLPAPLFDEDPASRQLPFTVTTLGTTQSAAATTTTTTAIEAAAPVATVTAAATVTATTPPRILGAKRGGVRRRHSTGSADEYLDSEGSVHYRRREGQRSELEREVSEAPKVTDLRDAVRSGLKDNVAASLDECSNVRQELMAQNAANGAGLLMLAVTTGKINILEFLASEIQTRLGTPLLAKQLRYEDDKETPLMFYAAKSSLSMFRAVRKLVRDTIGRAGLTEQLRHQCARGRNILMEASSDPNVFAEVWTLASRAGCLQELLEERDLEGRNWILHAAGAGNLAVFKQLDRGAREMYELFSTKDMKGWSGFMYAARGKGGRNKDFLTMLCGMCFPDEKDPQLSEQLTRVAEDDDASTLLMHAAIGGRESYAVVCRMIREAGCVDRRGDLDRDPVLLSWAAKGGDILALNAVAEGIKTGDFRDEVPYGTWYDVRSAEEAARLLDAIETCAKRRAGVSLYLSAIESGCLEMMSVVLDGIKDRVQDAKVRWEMLCGIEGNPLTLAASRSVECFRATLRALKDVALQDTTGSLKPKVLKLLLPSTELTPLCSAVFTEDYFVFDEVLKQATTLYGQPPEGAFCAEMILEQVKYAMRDVDEERRLSEEWISAKMLAKVLQAAKEVDKDTQPAGFDVGLLDNFVKLAVSIGAFDHIRELLKIGCDLVKHFPTLLSKIAKNENSTTECIMLAITAASNPFVECGIASQAVYEATIKRNLNHAALERLHQKIGDLSLELLEHLPHSVSGVGEELARGDLNLEPFSGRFVGKIKPSELLGFVVVGWMLEGSGQSSVTHDSPPLGGENSLAQAVRAGPRALDLLSEALILDYLGLKFYRTLPRWNTQKPFERNINQAFYSYTHQATATRESEERRYNGGVSQRLLLLLQGWTVKDRILLSRPHRTVLPGLQFTLSGIMGKPESYYVVPAIRMLFIVINYLITIGLYMWCVSLESQRIPENEWAFYVVMLGVAWREILEFSSAHKLEPGLRSSIERYFYDKWNFLDVTTIGLVLVAFVFRIIELFTGDSLDLALAQFFLAATAPFLFSRVLFLSQVGSALGPMTQVIFNMLTQLVQFSLILLLVMIGFAASFNALYGSKTVLVENFADCDVRDHPIVEAFGTLEAALLTMFQYMLGEFSFDVFYAHYENEDGEDCGGVSNEEFGITLLVIYLVITAVMLLNLLIALLSTAHAEVHQNSTKEFQLARAKIILQSGEDVLNDVIPPPFNLVKPLLGIFWPASSRADGQWDRWWEIITGTIHRTLFWLVVGLAALVVTILLWVVSIPLRAWSIYQGMRGDATTARRNKTDPKVRPQEKNGDSGERPFLRRPCIPRRYQSQWRPTRVMDYESGSQDTNGNAKSDVYQPRRITTEESPRQRSFKDDEIAAAIERIFFVSSGSRKGRLSPTHALSTLVKVFQMLVAILLAAVLCLVVYPLLSILLWLRGFGNILHYVKQMYKKTTRWERRQVDLGEEEEWSVARTHAIRRNRRYATANSSENEFNVDALLKTTTGMTMEDLRQKMVDLKSARRRMALTASLDAVLSQFPSDDKRL